MSSITLSPVHHTDAAELVQANLDSRAYHKPWTHPFTTLAGFEEWLEGQRTGVNAGFVARDVNSGCIAGVTNLSQIFRKGFQNAYLSYYGIVAFSRRGLMTEAVRQTVVYAFKEIGLHRLEANIQPGNSQSIALVKRLGFRKEGFSPKYLQIGGVWCDHERWAILCDETLT